MKNIIKITCIIAVLINILVFIPNKTFAAWNFSTEIKSLEGNTGKDESLKSTTNNIVGSIVNVIRIVGTGIAVIMLAYVAIKYMTAAPNEKAEFKKSATAYIVGAIVLFATTNIITVISKFATKNIG